MEDEQREDLPAVEGDLSAAQARHVAYTAAVVTHMRAAGPQAEVLIGRARALVRNGIDLRDPERMGDFVADQVLDAVRAATVHACGCAGAQGAAAAALLAELAHRLATVLEER